MFKLYYDGELIDYDLTQEEIDRFFLEMPRWAKALHAKDENVFEVVGDNSGYKVRIYTDDFNIFDVVSGEEWEVPEA